MIGIFKEPSFPLLEGENATIGGFEPKQLKNENGVRFRIPSSEMVEPMQSALVQFLPAIIDEFRVQANL